VSDLGYGLPVDTALRSCLIGTAPARGDVADGSAVLEAAQRLQPDVIVVDLNLPHVHGLEACRQLKQVKPEAIVIVFSAMNDPDLKQRSFEVGAICFVCVKGRATCSRPSNACVTTKANARSPDSTKLP